MKPSQLKRAVWCPLPLRRFFEGEELHLRCTARHEPQLVYVQNDVWIAACPRSDALTCLGKSGGIMFRLGVEADLPKEAKLLGQRRSDGVADFLNKSKPIDRAVAEASIPSPDRNLAETLGVDAWHYLVGRNQEPAIVGVRTNYPIAIIAPTRSGAVLIRNAVGI